MSVKLKQAKQIISDSNRWTQNYYARNIFGKQENILSAEAVCFCATGALYKAYNLEPQEHFLSPVENLNIGLSYDYICLNSASRRLGYDNCVFLNDCSDHSTVLKMYDLAIQLQNEKD